MPSNTFYSELILIHKTTVDYSILSQDPSKESIKKETQTNKLYKESNKEISNSNNKDIIQILDYGKLPSLRKLEYPKPILEYITFEEQQQPTCLLDKNILDLSLPFISDHDLFYLMRGVQNINGLATIKILPYNKNDFKMLSSNKMKILPLPLKDINFNDIPLTYKIRQIVQKQKREKLKDIQTFNPKEVEDYASLKIDVLFDNEDLAESFNINNEIEIDIYKFPHYISTFSKSSFSFTNIKNCIARAFAKLNITNESGKGIIFVLTTSYIFIAPLTKPYINFKKELEVYADPMFYTGIFTLPVIDAEWDETIERSYIKFDLLELLKTSSS